MEKHPVNITSYFAKTLREARKENGLSQAELADNAGFSPKYVYKLETGKANPTIRIANMLARALGIPITRFFLDEEGNNIDFVEWDV